MTMAEAICCTLVNCNCDSFKPGKLKRRQCENCKHGWVAHALSKLKVHHMYQSSQVEIVHSNVVFDICSLMLYGTQAIPVRLKILLDRLFSVLKQDEVIHILNALDWTLQDYIRGYVLQDVAGKVLDRWAIMTFEEEIATLQQFLRFGETKSIVELMALQDKEGQAVLVPSTRTNSDIRTFIERSTPRNPANLLTPKIEKLNNNNNVHHFENFINSMAFMLPFQLLGSVPAPLLGSAPGPPQPQQASSQQHPPQMDSQGPKRDEQGHRDAQGRDGLVSLPHPPTENSLLGSSSASFTSDLDRGDNGIDGLSITTKMEVEDFPTSDNYSDGPSTPCTPSMSSEVMQMSPETKLRCLDRNGGGMAGGGHGLKKGRVYCSACEKTFYDKGTLKIHYNAVHLKIKHKCTIDGCNMVFSSLRSRNRHSANPNPRLHMPMNRNNRDKDLRGGNLSADEGSESDRRSEYGTPVPVSSSSAESHKSVPSYMVSHVDASNKLHGSSFPSMGHQSGILFPNLKTVQPVLPFYRSLVTPAELANTPGTLPSLPLLSSSVPLKPASATTMESCATMDPVPKKKSRKSSMPIKIEKEAVERDEGMEPGSSSEDEGMEQLRDREAYDGKRAGGHACSRQAPEERDREDHSVVRELLAREKASVEEEDRETQLRRRVETGVITCASSPYDSDSLKRGREHADRRSLFREPAESDEAGERECVHAVANKPCRDLDREEEEEEEGAECRATANGVALCPSEGRERGDGGTEQDRAAGEYGDGGLSHLDPEADLPHHCEICSKTFKNPYSVKMHYRNVHLKEMHMCTVDGCNAAFPSRRSRDRHSSNLNLHHKLLTRDTYSPVYSPLSHCRDSRDNFLGLDFCPEQQQQRENNNNNNRELPHRDSTTQTSVIFRGARNRMGLVYPMSKTADAPPANADAAGMEGAAAAGEREGGGGGEDGAVLDLSTSAASAPPRNVRSSWDSDGAGSEEGEGLEEDEEEEDGEEDGEALLLPMDDSDDSCDGLGGVVGGRPGGGQELGLAAGAERTLLSCGGVVGGGGGGQGAVGSGSPITCHVCQKVYSNKGTFRAHYKTVHLRLLHKCKVPGCDTSFSSVRSRNRHSQNPNLHRNLAVSSGTSLDHD